MEPSAAAEEAPSKDPFLPSMFKLGNIIAPKAPQTVKDAGLDDGVLPDLAVKLVYTVANFTSAWVAQQLRLSLALTAELLQNLCTDGLVEELWQTGRSTSRYRITQRGSEQAARLREVCGYIGPAPVRLEAYAAMLRWQFASTPQVKPEHVAAAFSDLVLTPEAMKLAGLAASSGRSLFIFGPPGNGKSSVGRGLRAALRGDYWIPHCISVADTIIRLYDQQCHDRVEVPTDKPGLIDDRWIRIRRPLIVVGGELTLELLDLIYSQSARYYEAPPHLKASGGVFLVDDFGRERVSPEQLLNRFITPMEHQIDYFQLATGRKIQVPLRNVLIIATNLSPEKVTDPAFLRRMGYRLYLGSPSPEQYGKIFQAYAQRHGATASPELIEQILERYRKQGRELRACEPRDLIERARDICRYHGQPLELTSKVLDLAWTGYFGNQAQEPAKSESSLMNAATGPS
jgi:hypothetical protein